MSPKDSIANPMCFLRHPMDSPRNPTDSLRTPMHSPRIPMDVQWIPMEFLRLSIGVLKNLMASPRNHMEFYGYPKEFLGDSYILPRGHTDSPKEPSIFPNGCLGDSMDVPWLPMDSLRNIVGVGRICIDVLRTQ
eukprot:1786468-Pyramimonas_sp.AAC.1